MVVLKKEKNHGKKRVSFEYISIDLYAYSSKLRDWNSDFKIIFAITTLVLSIMLDNPFVSISVILAMGYLTVKKGGLELRTYLSMLTIPLAFILLSSITIALGFSKSPLGEFNLDLRFFYLYTSKKQIEQMIFLDLKALAALSSLQMMTLSTPMSDIISFLKKIYCPKLIIELMYLTYRFLFILLEVYNQMKISAEARLGYYNFKTSCLTFGKIVGNTLVISMKKANLYYDAMEARCYTGELSMLDDEKTLNSRNIIFAVLFVCYLFIVWLLTKN